MLDNRGYDNISAVLYYKKTGDDEFVRQDMTRKVKAIFTGFIPENYASEYDVVEYYIEVSDGTNTTIYPEFGNGTISYNVLHYTSCPTAPVMEGFADNKITWQASEGDVHWYKIYRSETPDFTPSMSNYLTHVSKETLYFSDMNPDFAGNTDMDRAFYYKVAAVDILGNESDASDEVRCVFDKKALIASNADFNTSPVLNSAAFGGRRLQNSTGTYTRFADVNFGYGTDKMNFRANCWGPCTVDVWIDGMEGVGEHLGTVTLNEGDWGRSIIETPFEFKSISGVHDIYLKYNGDSMFFQSVSLENTFENTSISFTTEQGDKISPLSGEVELKK